MRSKARMTSRILAAMIVLALAAPFAMAAQGDTVTVQYGESKRFELYRKRESNNSPIKPADLYRDFTSVVTGDENIAQIVEQNGVFQVVGKSTGITTYEAAAKDGETFTGSISVIERVPDTGINKTDSGSNGIWISGGNGRFQYCVDYYVFERTVLTTNVTTSEATVLTIGESGPQTVVERDASESTAVYTDGYGRIRVRPRYGAINDITLSAAGNIRLEPDGYFYKEGEAASVRPGYATKLWGGTITMTSPTLGTASVDVYLE